MSYHVKFNDITSMHIQTQATIQQWGASITNLSKAVEGFARNSSLQGKAMTSAQTYMREVHGTLLQTLLQLMNDYSTSFYCIKMAIIKSTLITMRNYLKMSIRDFIQT